MGWEMVKLGDVLEKVKSPRAGEESYPVLSITRSEGLVNQDERFGKRIASASTKDYKVVFRNELVVGFPIDEGVIDFQQLYEKAIVSPAYGIWRVTNPERVDLSFLARFLRSDRAIFYYQAKMRGTTARRRSLPDSLFLELPVPLPPLEEQQRIAKILGTVEEAIRAEEQSISKLETLAKNLAPETNRTVPIGEYVERIVSGKSLKEHSTPGGPRVLKISSTTSGYFKPEESKPLDPSYEPPEHHRVQEGDLLVSRANTTELVGASAIVDQPYENLLLPDKLWRLVTKDSVDPFFLWACLQHPLTRNAISKASSGSGGSMKNISQTDFLATEIPDVDAALQTTVGNQVRTAFHQRALRSSKLTLLRELYTSLSSRAFSREL